MRKLTRDRIIVIVWTVVFIVFLVADDYVSAGITAALGMILAIKEAVSPTDYSEEG